MAKYGPSSRPEVQPKVTCCRYRFLPILAFLGLFLLRGVDLAWTKLPASQREGRRTDGPLGVGGSRVRPHIGMDPYLALSRPELSSFSDLTKSTHRAYWGKLCSFC